MTLYKTQHVLNAAFLCFLLLLTQSVQAQARTHVRFDGGWRFHQDPPAVATASGTPINAWRWKFAPTLQSAAAADAALPPDTETGWQGASVGQDVFTNQPGYAWFRADLGTGSVSAPGHHQVLHFLSVDDNATVYVNGKRLLHHEGWNDPFNVPIDVVWNPSGPNTLTILVQNTGGGGGIGQPATLEIAGPTPPPVLPAMARATYDDRKWRVVHLPHDYVVEGQFTQSADTSHGSLPVTTAWYRKTFILPASDKGKSVWLTFDGVYRDSVVYLNGQKLGEHKSGYTGFSDDISKAAHFGGTNVLAVSVDPRRPEGWWYEGGGIYRHVWLNTAAPIHIAQDGVYVNPQLPEPGPDGKAPLATVEVQTALSFPSPYAVFGIPPHLVWTVRDSAGRVVGTASAPVTIGAALGQKITVRNPLLWSTDAPHLYTLHTAIVAGDGKVLDAVDTPFGIRTIRFDPNNGFFLNGKRVEIKGTCNHQDFAGVGIAMPDSLQVWRLKRLQEMGSNAYRTSHNPPTPELLDACDRLGILVMDENRHLGDTYASKSAPGTPYSDLTDLSDMVLRDRNHPSIIMWSMCNEEWSLGGSPEGATIFTAMKDAVHQLDVTRPITSALNSGFGYGITNVEDLQGINYNEGIYDQFHKDHPVLPMYSSETGSDVGTRGIYTEDPANAHVSQYLNHSPFANLTTEAEWNAISTRPYIAGCFLWTGFDYKGEPTPYGWPDVNSHFGEMDMCGFPKENYYFYQSVWKDTPMVHLMPHWNWAGKEGQPIEVWCHTNAASVELFLNGRSLGTEPRPSDGSHLTWSVPYAPGTLTAKGYSSGGQVIATDTVETTGPPAALKLTTDRTTLAADGEDVTMVDVSVVDAQGRVVPTADNFVTFQVTGGAAIAGVGNGDPSSHEPDKAASRHAFNGLCLAVIQAGEAPGPVQLTATADGLTNATMPLKIIK